VEGTSDAHHYDPGGAHRFDRRAHSAAAAGGGESARPRQTLNKKQLYDEARAEIRALVADEGGPKLDRIAMMATISSVLAHKFDYYFWTGFYRAVSGDLVVGPYIGTVGCLVIPFGKGVCGTAAARRETVIVPNVDEFPGHIACDSRSRSEIVVPVLDAAGELIAVLDVDSDRLDAFDESDREGLEAICREISAIAPG
jgi:GAF domain-containing protein